jgi:hypothetical protein
MDNTKQVEMELEYIGRTKHDGWDCNEWIATLEYDGKMIETPFFTGLAISEPIVDDVIYSLLMDNISSNHTNFEDWAEEMGYDTDSRKAEQTYRNCLESGHKIRMLLGDDIEYFEEKYEDY